MNTYEVLVSYEGCVKMYVEAKSEEEAENIARDKFYSNDHDKAIAANAQISEVEAEKY